MSLALNLGDVFFDKVFGVRIVIAAQQTEDGKVVLEGYEANSEVERVFQYIEDDQGRVAIVLENVTDETTAVPGDGYYTWTTDPALEVHK